MHLHFPNKFLKETLSFKGVGCFKKKKNNESVYHFVFYPATSVRKNFVTAKFRQILKLSHPLQWEKEQKLFTIKLLSYLIRNNMETYYPCT